VSSGLPDLPAREGQARLPATLTLYTRAGCPLCDEMAAEIHPLIASTRYRLERVDVDADPALRAQYGWEVPVLFGGATEICRHQLNLPAFRDWLRAHP